MKNQIYDCTTFYQGNLLFEMRFNILKDIVDYFVVCEANKDHTGNSKEFNFNPKIPEQYKDKIIYIKVENLPAIKIKGRFSDDNKLVRIQMENLFKGIEKAKADDIIIFSDEDEIPNPVVINKFQKEKYKFAIFMQNMYYYKFNIHWSKGLKWNNKWPGTKSCRFKYFETVDKIRKFRVKNIPWWRFDRKVKRYVESDGGWHFTFLMDTNDISKKLSRFSHEIDHLLKNKDYDMNNLLNVKEIEKRILDFKDPYDRSDVKLIKVKIDNTFPEYIFKNVDKLSNYIV